MYSRFASKQGLTLEVLDLSEGKEAGIQGVTLRVEGKGAKRLLQESGIHRIQRVSPFDKNKKRHTSFSSVTIIPEIQDESIQIKEDDLEWQFCRAGGPGGQKVNKANTAVRLRHKPTGIVVNCRMERSQRQNRDQALIMLRSRLVCLMEEQRKTKIEELSAVKELISFGGKDRTYSFHPSEYVINHKNGKRTTDLKTVLAGNLNSIWD